MAKDIFGDNYFERHRNNSTWSSLGKRKLHEALNVKNKPKPKLEEVIPPKKEEKPIKEQPSEKIQDEEFKQHNKNVGNWKSQYFKNVLAGLVGGFLVILVQQINLFANDILTLAFWTDAAIAILIGLVFITLFGMIYRAVDN